MKAAAGAAAGQPFEFLTTTSGGRIEPNTH